MTNFNYTNDKEIAIVSNILFQNRQNINWREVENYIKSRFAIPVFHNGVKTEFYNVYMVRIVINHAANGRKYLYDMVDIKKEASTPFKEH